MLVIVALVGPVGPIPFLQRRCQSSSSPCRCQSCTAPCGSAFLGRLRRAGVFLNLKPEANTAQYPQQAPARQTCEMRAMDEQCKRAIKALLCMRVRSERSQQSSECEHLANIALCRFALQHRRATDTSSLRPRLCGFALQPR